ncbi:hypothetical protein EUAN_16260 [Andreesenia angusta]|uniref:SLAP domain-containing protein n=1 Tax=Andreesenia angusta TaxID=39480 RepID=A0A1S1V5E2_9FIRM|nr:SLAP domain-containing protein [Andreesenia angusta]OHW61863.1 hypothetical protein EUAN_16260 [Andreesenia angusta]
MGVIGKIFKGRQSSDKSNQAEYDSSGKEYEGQKNEGEAAPTQEYVELRLSIHPEEDARTSDMERNQLEQELKDCKSIKKNDINVSGIYAFRTDEGLEVSFFFRNGLERPVMLKETPLAVISKDGKLLARQEFDLTDMGEVEGLSARPWRVHFDPKNVFSENVAPDDWAIIFDIKSKEK